MSPVVHLRKLLSQPPVALGVAEVEVRHIEVPDDVAAWLELRQRAVAGLTPAPRPWLHDDYRAEMLDKPWWHLERNWVAVPSEAASQIAGTVTLAVREGTNGGVPVVHWLLVDPAWRRRGIGRLLMSHLEQAVWDAGWREVQLETHAGWTDAVSFYHSMGFEPQPRPSPR